MIAKLLIIANPSSGNGQGLRVAERVAGLLIANNVAVEVRSTTSRGEAETIATEALTNGYSRIIACGGDGTVHEIVNALARWSESKASMPVSLGIIPCGRGNDFARALGIPSSPHKAAEVILQGYTKTIDLGTVNNRYFATVATLGFDSEVAQLVYDGAGPFKGAIAYFWGMIRMLRIYQGVELRMSGAFGTVTQMVLLAATGNTTTYGGGIKIVPNANPEDGQLDICLVRIMSVGQILRVLPKVYWGGHLNHPNIFSYRTDYLKLETDRPVVIFADGEPVGETPATIISRAKVLSVLCPNPLNGESY